jgi:two-component system, LytTR family, sensor kinase
MIFTKSKRKLVTVLIHVLAWAVFGMLLFFFQPLSWNVTLPYQLWIKQSIIFGLLVIAFYLNSELIVPHFLLTNKTVAYLLIVVGVAAVMVFLNGYVDRWLQLPQLMDAAFHKDGLPHRHRHLHSEWEMGMIAPMIGTCALVLGISTSITVMEKWQKDRLVHQEMEQDKISSELSFLKAQINPHFFFNTLNNIYALTLVNADTSRKAIHQLSRMMRYVLYDTQNSTTQLSQEIAFVKDYISLMQLRLTDVVKVDFSSPASLKDLAIAPMIFLPFIENAFKHGVSATQPSNISLSIEQNNTVVELKVVNTIIKEQSNNLEEGSGIGLNNTRRRLDLLYPGKHILMINEDAAENTYSVHLTLDLS